MSRFHWDGKILALLLLIGIITPFVCIFRELQKWNDHEVVVLHSLTDLEQRVHLHFPPETVFLDGRALFGFGGGRLVARIRMPGKAVPKFLAQVAIRQNPSKMAGIPAVTLPSEAKITTDLKKAAANPSKQLTAEEIETLNASLTLPTEQLENRTKVWGMDQIRHRYHADTPWNGISVIDVTVNLDDPSIPILYVFYDYF